MSAVLLALIFACSVTIAYLLGVEVGVDRQDRAYHEWRMTQDDDQERRRRHGEA